MKIAIFSDTYFPQINGVSKTLNKLINYFENNNIDYRLFAPSCGEEEDTHKIIRFSGFNFFLYPELKVCFPDYSEVKKYLDDFEPDIIHITTPFGIGLSGVKYAKRNKIPLVSSYHTNYPVYLSHFNLKFLETPCWSYLKWFHGHCEKNYSPSPSTLEVLKEKGIQNLEVWGRGIDTSFFSTKYRSQEYRQSLGIADKVVILYVGRISPEKDIDTIVDTANYLNDNYKESIHFLMVGDGPQLEDLKNSAPENMTFTGYLQGEDLSTAYASSDIFMFPSTTETFGYVVVEAMASGLPVIACESQGVCDNVINNYNGIVCEPKNQQDFINAAIKLSDDITLRKELAQNAINFAHTFDWERACDRLVESYERTVKQSSVLVNE